MREVTPAEDIAALFELGRQFWITGAIGSLVSVFLGAYFAYLMSSYTERRKRIVAETIALNRATTTVLSYFNTTTNLKRQIVIPKKAELDNFTQSFENYNTAASTTKQTILELKQKHLFLKITKIEFLLGSATRDVSALSTISGRPTLMAIELDRSAATLNEIIAEHNSVMTELMLLSNQEERLYKMLGLYNGRGLTDARFRATIEHMASVTDDILFFSSKIHDDITKHHLNWRKSVGAKSGTVLKLDFEDDFSSLIPSAENYSDWNNMPVVELREI